jgi:dipeptidyl-peptidase-3
LPAGINVPNYDEIRLCRGFRNVSLPNVILAVRPTRFSFVPDDVLCGFLDDWAGTRALRVAAHELYGHGSGTLLTQGDVAKGASDLVNPGRNVTTFWAEGEVFQTVFGSFGPPHEEARAEAAALHLLFKDEVIKLFEIPLEPPPRFRVNAADLMVHGSIAQLACYSPEVSQWKQTDTRARFAVLRAVLIWGRGVTTVQKVEGTFMSFINAANLDAVITAVEQLVVHLNYYKAARLPQQEKEFFSALTSIDDFWLEVPAQAASIRLPRGIQSGATIIKNGDELTLVGQTKAEVTIIEFIRSNLQAIRIGSEYSRSLTDLICDRLVPMLLVKWKQWNSRPTILHLPSSLIASALENFVGKF